MPKIFACSRARIDVAEAADHISNEKPQAAKRFYKAIDSTLRQLAETPAMRRVRECSSQALQSIRSFPVKHFENYLIFYRPRTDLAGIDVIRVLHGAG